MYKSPCKSPSKSPSLPGLRWAPPSRKAPSLDHVGQRVFSDGSPWGVSAPAPCTVLHHMALVSPACSQIWMRARLQPQPQTIPETNASDKAAGKRRQSRNQPATLLPALPPQLCHCWGLQGCRFPLGMVDSHLAHAKRLGGKAATLSQPRGIAWLLKGTVGRKGKGNRKGKCLQEDFVTNQMETSRGQQRRGAPMLQVAPGQCSAASLGYHGRELF